KYTGAGGGAPVSLTTSLLAPRPRCRRLAALLSGKPRMTRPSRVRWGVVALLTGFSITSYLQRMNISIASKFMMPDLGLSQIQMGQVFSSFLIGYTIFQIPTGILGDRRGPKLVLTLAALTWGITTLLTGLVPG